MREWHKLILVVGVFLLAYFVPFDSVQVQVSILEALHMLQEYAREHVLFCLIPALFIAGAISTFISQGAVLRYFGGEAPKYLAYSVASVSGGILAVCSCTVLPLFAGIWKKGAGIGPASAFLYSGPAINILAIILTARVLGWQLGLARAAGAILFAVVVGLLMSFIFRHEETKKYKATTGQMPEQEERRSPAQNLFYFAVLIFILIIAAWSKPQEATGFWHFVFGIKWYLVVLLLGILAFILLRWFEGYERSGWVDATWDFTKQILPLLFGGVLIAGLLMGRPGVETGLIPQGFVETVVGGNSLQANFLASVVGAFMYFATLTEIPIMQGLLGQGMGQGPALALLLAGPALSLPSMLVIRSVIGTTKTLVYVSLVIVMSTLAGLLYGVVFPG
ncbi:MAG: permease [Dethiobacteria bacterium]|jgi:uncharacterized membrane protein YraQ (UPF0718 family)